MHTSLLDGKDETKHRNVLADKDKEIMDLRRRLLPRVAEEE
jgi:hypothetical protein